MLNGMKAILLTLMATAFATAAQAEGSGKTFASPGDEDAAVVRTDVELLASGIYPVRIVAIDGDNVSTGTKNALYLEPGKYRMKIEGREKDDMSTHAAGSVESTLSETAYTLDVNEDKVYYLGAKVNENLQWSPVLWRVEDADLA